MFFYLVFQGTLFYCFSRHIGLTMFLTVSCVFTLLPLDTFQVLGYVCVCVCSVVGTVLNSFGLFVFVSVSVHLQKFLWFLCLTGSFMPFSIFIIIIVFKGAIQDFSTSSHCAATCLQRVCSSGSGAIVCKSCAAHRALITCNMSCYVPRGTKGQLSY